MAKVAMLKFCMPHLTSNSPSWIYLTILFLCSEHWKSCWGKKNSVKYFYICNTLVYASHSMSSVSSMWSFWGRQGHLWPLSYHHLMLTLTLYQLPIFGHRRPCYYFIDKTKAAVGSPSGLLSAIYKLTCPHPTSSWLSFSCSRKTILLLTKPKLPFYC